MKTIKQRETAKDIKVMDKSLDLTKRMKNAYIRTKELTKEAHDTQSASLTDYAVDNVQNKASSTAQGAIRNLSNPRKKARSNVDKAKIHFQDARQQLEKNPQGVADCQQKPTHRAGTNSNDLRKAAGKAQESAKDAKKVATEAKQKYRQVQADGQQTLRRTRQKARLERRSKLSEGDTMITDVPNNGVSDLSAAELPMSDIPTPQMTSVDISPNIASTSGTATNSPIISFSNNATDRSPLDTSPGNATGGFSRPSYLNKGISTQRSIPDVSKELRATAKPAKQSAKQAGSPAKTIKRATKGTVKTTKKTVKSAKKSIKTAGKTAKKSVKSAKRTAKAAQKSAKAAIKTAKATEKAARIAAKNTARAIKLAIRAAIAIVKAAIAIVKAAISIVRGLVAIIAAGGWVAVLVILIICLVALLVGSTFGIFFSDEPDPQSGKTINGVIAEINTEYTDIINGVVSGNPCDMLDMSGARASWKHVLAVYTVRTVSDPDNPMEVATMNDDKAVILRTVFWEMNSVSYSANAYDLTEDVLDEDGLPTGETTTVTYTVLQIVVSHKSIDEIAAEYGFTDERREWLDELLDPQYNSLWNSLLYGITTVGDGSMIGIADTQIGNVGGETYWGWYGFGSREAWCACFVSWCAEQCGYIEAGILPRFSSCADGIEWFDGRGQWRDSTYTPSAGDLIFFDWEPDGVCDHVGIVESVAYGMVNTIEGNSSDSVARRSYDLGSVKIFGYGVPVYG